MRRVVSPPRVFARVVLALPWAALAVSGGCGGPDPRTPEGAVAYASAALEADDAARLFKVIDARSRHAMVSIVSDRRAARALVERDYPPAQRAEASRALGDAADVPDAAALFARRCDRACRDRFRAALGAPTASRTEDDELVVTTARGTTLRLHRKHEGDWWGLVYETAALSAERDRANRDLDVVRENAATYARQLELDTRR